MLWRPILLALMVLSHAREPTSASSWVGLVVGFAGVLIAFTIASLFYFGPPVTMIMAWIAFGDTLQTSDLVGLAVIAAGVLLVHGAGHYRARH